MTVLPDVGGGRASAVAFVRREPPALGEKGLDGGSIDSDDSNELDLVSTGEQNEEGCL